MSLLKKRVLIIDDTELAIELFKMLLETFVEPEFIVTVDNYTSGLKQINKGQWDYIISDQQLDKDHLGSELLTHVKGDIPCTLNSSEDHFRSEANRLGCQFFCKKTPSNKVVKHFKQQLGVSNEG